MTCSHGIFWTDPICGCIENQAAAACTVATPMGAATVIAAATAEAIPEAVATSAVVRRRNGFLNTKVFRPHQGPCLVPAPAPVMPAAGATAVLVPKPPSRGAIPTRPCLRGAGQPSRGRHRRLRATQSLLLPVRRPRMGWSGVIT